MGFEGVAAGDAGADLVVVGVDAVDIGDGFAAAGVAVANDWVAVVFLVHFHEDFQSYDQLRFSVQMKLELDHPHALRMASFFYFFDPSNFPRVR